MALIYHHYWFYDPHDHPSPRPHLHAPLEAMLRDGEPNVTFALPLVQFKMDKYMEWSTNGIAYQLCFLPNRGCYKNNTIRSTSTIRILLWRIYQWLRRFFFFFPPPKFSQNSRSAVYSCCIVRKPGSFPVLPKKLRQLAEADGFSHRRSLHIGWSDQESSTSVAALCK
jgi:hypothetical protein